MGIDRALVSSAATEPLKPAEGRYRAFICGGAVRDLMLGMRPKDLMWHRRHTEQVQRIFRRARIIGRRFKIVHVMFGSETIEVSTFRPCRLTTKRPMPTPCPERQHLR